MDLPFSLLELSEIKILEKSLYFKFNEFSTLAFILHIHGHTWFVETWYLRSFFVKKLLWRHLEQLYFFRPSWTEQSWTIPLLNLRAIPLHLIHLYLPFSHFRTSWTVSLCVLRLPASLKALSHLLLYFSNRFSHRSWTIFSCLTRVFILPYDFQHLSHLYFFRALWSILLCLLR